MSLILEAQGLRKSFHRTRSKEIANAVNGVDISVTNGERVALLGPNGAGKTTTLLMLLGAVSPDAGSVVINGIDAVKHRREAAQSIGFMAGYLSIPGRVRVWEYLKYSGQLYGLKLTKSQIEPALERFQIANLANAMGAELSSGQRTLVSVVRTTLHDPPLLVLDEPTAYLDPDVSQRVRLGLLNLNKERGTAFLITSHNMTEVARLCERIVFIAHGQVVANGSPDELTKHFGHDELEGVFLQIAEEQREVREEETL